MNKAFKYYAAVWTILLAAFNLVCFATPNELFGLTKIDHTFWTAYVFITVAFIGNLACAFFAFKAENLKKTFYNLPLITFSYIGLIILIVVGAVAMMIPYVPSWVGALMCIIILAFTAIAVVKAKGASDIVEAIDEKVKTQTSFIKNLTVDAESILSRAKSDAVRAECKKVYEAVRYSDPMYINALPVIESKIIIKMKELSSAVDADDAEKVKVLANDIEILIYDRNNNCKSLK